MGALANHELLALIETLGTHSEKGEDKETCAAINEGLYEALAEVGQRLRVYGKEKVTS